MPTYAYLCECGRGWEGYIHSHTSPNPPCECGLSPERVWSLGSSHRGATGFPYVTTNITPDGSPVEVTSPAHLDKLCKEYGVTHRPDNGWIDKEYLGVDMRTGVQRYKEGNGVGYPGCWI